MLDLLLYLVLGLCVLLWVWLLRDCLRRRHFAASFGSPTASRRAWLLSFLLVNPLQVLLYLGLVRLPGERVAPSRKLGALAGVMVTALALFQFGWVGAASSGPLVAVRGEDGVVDCEGGGGGWGLHVAVSWSGQSSSSTSALSENGPQVLRHIVIRAERDDDVLADLGRRLVQKLADEPFARRVSFEPASLPADAARPPTDLLVLLDRTVSSRFVLPGLDTSTSVLSYRASRVPWAPTALHRNMSTRYSEVTLSGTVEQTRTRLGVSMGRARVQEEAAAFVERLSQALITPLRKVHRAHGTVRGLPGPAMERPPLPRWPWLGEFGARLLWSGAGLFVHGCEVWHLDADDDGAPDRVASALGEAGFVSKTEGGGFPMRAGDLLVGMTRPVRKAPIRFSFDADVARGWILVVERRHTKAELLAAAARALEAPDPVPLAMVLRPLYREENAERFFELVTATPAMGAQRMLTTARAAFEMDRDDLGRRMTRGALAVAQLFDRSHLDDVKRLAKRHGWPEGEEPAAKPDGDALVAAGIRQLAVGAEVSVQVPVGGAVLCFGLDGEGRPVGYRVRVLGREKSSRHRLEFSIHQQGGASATWGGNQQVDGAFGHYRAMGDVRFRCAVAPLPDGRCQVTVERG